MVKDESVRTALNTHDAALPLELRRVHTPQELRPPVARHVTAAELFLS
jgi:hypothetical protein